MRALGLVAIALLAGVCRASIAQSVTTVQQGTDFAKALAPKSAGDVVNPTGVNSQTWGSNLRTPTTIPSTLAGFSAPTTGDSAYTTAKSTGLTSFGASALTSCAGYTPGANADPYQTQACAAVNFLNNSCLTPSTQQTAVMTKLGQNQVAGNNCAGTYGNSVRTFNFPNQVSPSDPMFTVIGGLRSTAAATVSTTCSTQSVVTTPAQFETNTCIKNSDVTVQTCSQYLNVTDKTTTTPAVEKYTCVGGVLSGQYCESSVTTPAAQTYLCPAGSDLQDTSCIATDTSAATPVYSCPAGFTLSGSMCTRQAVTTATWGLDCSIAKDLAAGTGASPTGYPYWGITPTNPPPPVAQAIPPGYCWLYATTATLQKLAQYSNVIVGSTYYSGVGSLPFIAEFQDHSYSCPNGGTLSGTTCVTSSTLTGTVSSYTCPTGTLEGSNCVTSTTSPATAGYTCAAGSTLTGTSCTTTSSAPATASYSCSDGSAPVGDVCEVHSVATSWTDACSQYNGGPLPTP